MADSDITTGATFGDLPDVRITADGEQVVVTKELPPPPPSAAQAQGPQYIPVPVAMPTPAPQESDADFLRKLTMARQASEQEARDRMQREFWQKTATPPSLPDDDDALTDPKVVKDILRKQAEWTRNLVTENARVLGATVAQLNEEAQQSRLTRAELAAERARASLVNQGMSDVDAYWPEVENVLRRDPENYWKIRTNPMAMEQAVRMVRDHMVRSGQVVPVQQPPMPPATAPYGHATTGSAHQQAQGGASDPGLRRIEKLFGINFRPEDLAKRRIVNPR